MAVHKGYKQTEEHKRKKAFAKRIHGDSHASIHHYLYNIWTRRRSWCFNPKSNHYKWYGARGITLCREWADNYVAFKTYILETIGERPKGMSLDRIDNDGNYEPGNIQWATQTEQHKNQRHPTTATHGTHSKYSEGCRCNDCKHAHMLYQRELRAR